VLLGVLLLPLLLPLPLPLQLARSCGESWQQLWGAAALTPACPPGRPRSIYEGLRRVLPGRPEAGQRHRGVLQLVEDAGSAVLCGGLAGEGTGVRAACACARGLR
jgi:hypothetical protein